MDLPFKFLKGIERDSLTLPGDSILIAVSGGIDSCVLLHLLAGIGEEFGFSLAVGHVNHGFRGAESDADEDFVRSIALKYSLSFYSERFPGLKDGDNLHDAARNFRYDALMRMALSAGAKKIAFAHNRNDQAETVLFNLIRGAGLDGLSGMPKKRALSDGLSLIRPILDLGRDEIAEYARSSKINYREDSSNSTSKYSRNSLRHNVFPELLKLNSGAIDHIFEAADLLREEDEYLDSLADDLLTKLIDGSVEGMSLKLFRKGYADQPEVVRRRVVRLAFKKLTGNTKDLKTDHIFRIDQIACSCAHSGEYALPQGVCFEREGDHLFFNRK